MDINYKRQKEKIISISEKYLKIGKEKGYFVFDKGKVEYLAVCKKYNFSDPEEKI